MSLLIHPDSVQKPAIPVVLELSEFMHKLQYLKTVINLSLIDCLSYLFSVFRKQKMSKLKHKFFIEKVGQDTYMKVRG